MNATPRSIRTAAVSGFLCVIGFACTASPEPAIPQVPATISTTADTTTPAILPPSEPSRGGSPLPVSPLPIEEIDCDNAEEVCDSGDYVCDDLADYCDIGPDGGELPEDWDWDS